MKKTRHSIYFSVIFLTGLFSLSACGGRSSGDKKTITISGAFALYPLVNVWTEAFRKEHPDIRFNVSGGGAGKGMADVLNGAADIGMFSREISPAERGKGAWWIAVATDAVIPTISAKNPQLARIKAEGLTRSDLHNYFLKEGHKYWKGTAEEVNVYTRSDAAGAADVWVKYLGGQSQGDVKGIAVFGDPGLADAVKNDPRAIGYNNVNYVYDLKTGKKYPGMEVAPIDLNGNGKIDPEEDFYGSLDSINAAIADGRYPAPPARALYLITKGKPGSGAVKLFLSWVLTRGQAFVQENGYILLSKDMIETQKEKL